MPTLHNVIETVLPRGSNVDDDGWREACQWPPDLFAAMALITEWSGLYSDPVFTCAWRPGFLCRRRYTRFVTIAGRQWRTSGKVPAPVQNLWARLLSSYRDTEIGPFDTAPKTGSWSRAGRWRKIVFTLVAIADEACHNIGFANLYRQPLDDLNLPAEVTYHEYINHYKRKEGLPAPDDEPVLLHLLPHSLCQRVPKTVRCVQPKTNVPAVGTTLRSLTNNVALLPPCGHVLTSWHIANTHQPRGRPFNLLVVPFPYSVPGQSFCTSDSGRDLHFRNDASFKICPAEWMGDATPEQFGEFLCGLAAEGAQEVNEVHGVVLPEGALPSKAYAEEVAAYLAENNKHLELFVTGLISEGDDPQQLSGRNLAATFRFAEEMVRFRGYQSKHHRWCLNGAQVKRYNLGHVLAPDLVGATEPRRWWEQIDVSQREVCISLIRPDASLCVLVCEDLARYDPVLPVMNAIGPNLIIALLMDGPQLEHRWCGRYATALAEDPGSSVLTVSSLGMVLRSTMPGEAQSRSVALWRDPSGVTHTLTLPDDCHALLLTLTGTTVEQKTLDMRSDGNSTTRFVLSAAHGVQHPKPPPWLKRSSAEAKPRGSRLNRTEREDVPDQKPVQPFGEVSAAD